MRIIDESDNELPEIGAVPFVDTETTARLVLPSSSSAFRNAWRDDNRRRVAHWQEACIRHGAVPLTLSTDDEVVFVLSNFFSYKGRGQ